MIDLKICQWLIDTTQKRSAWWSHQTAGFMVLGSAMMAWFDKGAFDTSFDCFLVLSSLGVFFASLNESLIAIVAERDRYWRAWSIYFWCEAIANVVLSAISFGPRHPASVIFHAAFAANIVFCQCKPPAPPKPRGRFAKGQA